MYANFWVSHSEMGKLSLVGKEKGSELVQFNHAWDISITPTDTGDSGVKRNGLPCITLMVLQGSQMLAASIRRAENELGSKRSISETWTTVFCFPVLIGLPRVNWGLSYPNAGQEWMKQAYPELPLYREGNGATHILGGDGGVSGGVRNGKACYTISHAA